MNHEAIAAWDARAQDLFGFMLLDRADTADVAEFNRTVSRLQSALCAEPVVLPDADDWLMSYAARDYLPESED
jgi:hypothetical protein